MIGQKVLEQELLALFAPYWVKDGQPNGLQVPRNGKIGKIVGGVSASLALIDAAILHKADAILVHHGWFWGSDRRITAQDHKRLSRLLEANMALFSYHLPLDFHPTLGNNVKLAQHMGWTILANLRDDSGSNCGYIGSIEGGCTGQELAQALHLKLDRAPLWIDGPHSPKKIFRLGWCSGAGQKFISAACDQDLDAFISGEISEQTFHVVQENKIHYFAAGHHATERYGVMALGQWIRDQLGISFEFIEIFNPI